MDYDVEAITNAIHIVDHANVSHERPSDQHATYHGEVVGKPGHLAIATLGLVGHYVGLAL
jgi:hypothetical protein